jgi:dethiobiotin synthetase
MTQDNKNNAIWITGTDTECGKTVATVALALALESLGADVGVMKPVASGLIKQDSTPISPDVRFYRAFLKDNDPLEDINPVGYNAPLAPSVAARLEHKTLDMAAIQHSFMRMKKRHDWLLVEGIGGVLVPLSDEIMAVDLASAMKLPAILVARAGLGTINHTLLSVEAMTKRQVPVLGIILNLASRHPDLAERTNPGEIEAHTGIKTYTMPAVPGVSTDLVEGEGMPTLSDALIPLAEKLLRG